MSNRTKLTDVQKYQKLSEKLSNPTIVNSLISRYQQDTKNAVLNIINMCKTVKEMNEKVKSGELTVVDLTYFCETVGLDKSSSTFRKFLCIADKAKLFEQYLDKVPASYTILYEITTLDSEQFELLLKSKQLSNFITLREVKQITGKQNVPRKNTSEVVLTVKFEESKISTNSLKVITECYSYLKALSDTETLISDLKVLEGALMKKAA